MRCTGSPPLSCRATGAPRPRAAGSIFDDLIHGTLRLLTAEKMAQWVLFRLDGGIDHILVDEAQGITSPPQWEIVKTLAEEIRRGRRRTDGRDPAPSLSWATRNSRSIPSRAPTPRGSTGCAIISRRGWPEVGQPFQSKELKHSFRSSPVILSLVDAGWRNAQASRASVRVSNTSPFTKARPGRVDLWPAVEATKGGEKPDWDDPQDIVADDHHSNILAKTIAERIAAMLAAGEPLPGKDGPRPVTAGDILILVQSRSPLFSQDHRRAERGALAGGGRGPRRTFHATARGQGPDALMRCISRARG